MQIEIKDTVSPAIEALRKKLGDGKAMHTVVAGAALPVFQRNFQRMAGVEHNRFGARGGFWNRMLSGTKANAENAVAIIRMPREVALRYHGGTVTPKKSKLLAIPARKEAYGKSPRDFSDLRFAVLGGQPALVQNEQTKISWRKDRKTGQRRAVSAGTVGSNDNAKVPVFYWLTPSATIKPNPAVLPSDDEIKVAVVDGVKNYLEGTK